MDLPNTDETLLTYAKMGPFALFGFVVPPKTPFKGTRVPVRQGCIRPKAIGLPHGILRYFMRRAREASEIYEKMSPQQLQVIQETIERNADKFVGSKQFEAMMYDYQMFGEDAIVLKGS